MKELEDIRKILELVKTNECSVGRAIHQIYSLFELEFNNALEADAHNWDTRELTKPNESRLLDEDEILDIWTKNKEDCGMVTDFARKVISKTASIVRVECAKEKAEFGLSVHESSRAMTLKEVVNDLIITIATSSKAKEQVESMVKLMKSYEELLKKGKMA